MNLFTTENAFSRPVGKLAPASVLSKVSALSDVKNIVHQKKPLEKGCKPEPMPRNVHLQHTPVMTNAKLHVPAFGIYSDDAEEDIFGHNHELCLSALENARLDHLNLTQEVISYFGSWKNFFAQKQSSFAVELEAAPELSLIEEPPPKFEAFCSPEFLSFNDFHNEPLPPTPVKSL